MQTSLDSDFSERLNNIRQRNRNPAKNIQTSDRNQGKSNQDLPLKEQLITTSD